MKISICIPSYNKKAIIETCIKSVVQNIREVDESQCSFELLVIDDRSTDGSVEFLHGLMATYPFLLIENRENKGLVKNWNECILQASGDFILILHADDILSSLILKKYVAYFLANPDCKFLHANATDVFLPFFKSNERVTQQEKVLAHGDPALRKIILNNNLACSTVIVSRACYDKLGNFDENCWVSPDWEMWARIAKDFDIHHINVPGAFVILDNKNTHTSGIPLEVFRGQQIYYINKMFTYLSAERQKTILQECYMQLSNTLGGLGVQYFKGKKFRLSFEYISSTGFPLSKRLSFVAKGVKSFAANQFKSLFYPKKDFVDVVETLKVFS